MRGTPGFPGCQPKTRGSSPSLCPPGLSGKNKKAQEPVLVSGPFLWIERMNDQADSRNEQTGEIRASPRYEHSIFAEIMIVAIAMLVLVGALYSTNFTH